MSTFNINVKGVRELQLRLDNATGRLRKVVDQTIADGARGVAFEAINRAPGDQGFLKGGIKSVRVAEMQYKVISRVNYSAFVEWGTRSLVSVPSGLEEYASQFKGGFSSALGMQEAIFDWCKRKGIPKEAWYAVFLKILKVGRKPHPFFFPALNSQRQKIIDSVKRVLETAI